MQCLHWPFFSTSPSIGSNQQPARLSVLGISDVVSDLGVVCPAAGPVAINLDRAVGDVISSGLLEVSPDVEVANPVVRKENKSVKKPQFEYFQAI